MHRLDFVTLAVLAPSLILGTGCGSPQEDHPSPPGETSAAPETPYGSVGEVSAYLTSIQPLVAHIGQLQTDYEQALASAGQGGTQRRGTGHNLASKAKGVLPGLLQVRDELDAIEPPPLLAPFHRDTRKMLNTRIESLRKTIRGWKVEQEGGEFEAIYRDAETDYRAANDQIRALNEEVARINRAVEAATGAG